MGMMGLTRLPFGLRASLSASMVGLALLVSLVGLTVHTALTMRAVLTASSERARSVAQQAALLAGRATGEPGASPAEVMVRRDRALAALFESSLAGDPTLYDIGVFDADGYALAHSEPERRGRRQPARPAIAELKAGDALVQALRLLGPPRTFDEVVELSAAGEPFGEVRVGVSTALLRDQVLGSLKAGLWVMGVALLLAILVGLGLAHFLSQRVRTVVEGLQRFREGEFGYRLAVEGGDELALLASSINELGERLQATRDRAAAGELDQGELLQATDRMAAWAKVASGLLHEMADPLNAAGLHLGHLKRKWTDAKPEIARHLVVLEDELKRLDNVVDLIRGPKGSVLRLDVVPAQAVDMTRSKVVEITRDTVSLEDQAAKGEVIEIERDDGVHRIGAIKIPTFYVDFDAWQAGEEEYRSTTRDVAREIERLKEEGVEGIVLDLRNNGGGALQEANSLIGLFIDRGPTVQVRDARGRISLYGDTETGTVYDGPLGVLVNRLSASASEIFAGAIQDYGRGLVLGNPTFGKGTVQTLNELSHGQIKLTRAKFYRISGESTQHRGVEPDIIFPSLVDPEIIGESALDNALAWDTVRAVQYRTYGEPWKFLETLKDRHRSRADGLPNFRYLERQAELAKRLREQTTSVSLNREQRQREVKDQEAEQLALENQRRLALGLDPLEEWIDARDEDTDEEESVEHVQVLEAAQILLDYAQLNGSYRLADRH